MGYRSFIREQIALGRMPYVDRVQLRGYNAAIAATVETLWTPGGAYVQLTTAVALEAVSSSASDTAAGTGARTITVETLDANYNIVTQTVTLNGATQVALTGTHLAVNKVKVLTAGSGLTNAGTIDIRAVSGGAIKNQISTVAGYLGQSACMLYTVPKGYIGLLSSISFGASGLTEPFIGSLLTKDSNGLIFGEGQVNVGICFTAVGEGKAVLDLQDGLLIPEKTLVDVRVGTAASGVGIVTGMAQLLLFDVKNNGMF